MRQGHSFILHLLLLAAFFTIYQCKKSSPAPVVPTAACFNYNTGLLFTGQPDTFANCSSPTTFFLWSFGDGTTDNIHKSPVHSYQNIGTDTVKLFVWNQGSDTLMTYKTVTVNISDTNFTGNYKGAETCTTAGTDSTGYNVTSAGYSQLLFSNLYNSGKSFKASYNGYSGNIPAQSFSGDSLLLGSFTLSNDTILLNLIITAFSFRDNCTGIYVKH